jgi:hypothetical protein
MALHLSGFTPSGFRDVRRQEVSHLGFPGAETPKHQTLTCFTISGFRDPSHLDFETPNSSFTRGFLHRGGFREKLETPNSNTFRGPVSLGANAGTPGAEIPKYDNFSTLYLSGYRKSGFRDLRVQGISPLDIPDAETPKYRDLATLLFRDFACRDFGTCEYKGTRPWVSWIQIPTLKPAHLISGFLSSGFRKSGFRDLRVQGNSP